MGPPPYFGAPGPKTLAIWGVRGGPIALAVYAPLSDYRAPPREVYSEQWSQASTTVIGG